MTTAFATWKGYKIEVKIVRGLTSKTHYFCIFVDDELQGSFHIRRCVGGYEAYPGAM